jgi:hypothetical protein
MLVSCLTYSSILKLEATSWLTQGVDIPEERTSDATYHLALSPRTGTGMHNVSQVRDQQMMQSRLHISVSLSGSLHFSVTGQMRL